jgi:hypothetical protein
MYAIPSLRHYLQSKEPSEAAASLHTCTYDKHDRLVASAGMFSHGSDTVHRPTMPDPILRTKKLTHAYMQNYAFQITARFVSFFTPHAIKQTHRPAATTS